MTELLHAREHSSGDCLYKIKLADMLAWRGRGTPELSPLTEELWTVDSLWRRKSQFSLRMWFLVCL